MVQDEGEKKKLHKGRNKTKQLKIKKILNIILGK